MTVGGEEGSGTTVTSEQFRHTLARFASGVTVVTCREDGLDHAMTASSFTSVSLDPPLVLFCSYVETRFHDAVVESGLWNVSVLPEHLRGRATWFATQGRPLVGQFDTTRVHRSDLTDALLLDDALVTLECRTTDVHRAGDHDIVVGEVVRLVEAHPDGRPLLWFGSRYRTIGDDAAPIG